MSSSLAPRPFSPTLEWAANSRFVLPFVVYCAFAAFVYWAHGPEPTLNIDHISYIKLADEIRANYPNHDYWTTFNSVRAYGVLLAYALDWTGSHLITFKLVLATVTVGYLFAMQLFFGLATKSRLEAVLFSLLSGLFVSFGASMWGMTDFSASLQRTIIIPFVVLEFWFFFRFIGSPVRYVVYPGLMLLSSLHLGALHVFLVFGVFEMLDFAIRRRFRITWDLAYLALALVAAMLVQSVIERSGVGVTKYISNLLEIAVPPVAELIPPKPPAPPPASAKAPVRKAPGEVPATVGEAIPPPGTAPAAPPAPPPEPKKGKPPTMSHDEAWRIELIAFPWRNFPMPLATIATISLSFGMIFLLALGGAVLAFRGGGARPLDRLMATFAIAVPIAAFGLQILLWAMRSWLAVLPISFEEVRAINMIMLPAAYFVFRLYQLAPPFRGVSLSWVRGAIVIAFILQPIILLRATPESWRSELVRRAVAFGAIKQGDSLRMLFARQFLGLSDGERRFYYSSRPLIAWLEANTGPNDKVLTNLNELHQSGIKSVGVFLGMLDYQVWDPKRAKWAENVVQIDAALAARDVENVKKLGHAMGATYAVLDWPVEDAVYRDKYYSVIKVP